MTFSKTHCYCGAVAAVLSLGVVGAQTALAQEKSGQVAIVSLEGDESGSDATLDAAASELELIDSAVDAVAPQFAPPKEQHAWARFEAGAWRTVRVTAQTTPAGNGAATESSTTQTEILKAVADNHYVISVQATVEVGGKRIVGDKRERRLHLLVDRTVDQIAHVQKSDTSVPLNFLDVPCNVWELSYVVDSQSFTDTVFYSSEERPFLLQRISIQKDVDDSQPRSVERVEYVALQLPKLVRGDVLPCDCRRKSSLGVKGRTVEIAFVSDAIPGGEAIAWSTEWDTAGDLIRSTRTELLDYGYGPTESPPLTPRQQRLRDRQERRQGRRSDGDN